MNHSPAQILQQLLTEASSSLFTLPSADSDWPLFVGHLPDSSGVADEAACLYDTPGVKVARTNAGEVIDHGIQLKVRATSYEDGWAKLKAAELLLATVSQQSVTIDGTNYLVDVFSLTSPAFSMGVEGTGKRRESFAINGLVRVDEDV